jgi:hypothetical protein
MFARRRAHLKNDEIEIYNEQIFGRSLVLSSLVGWLAGWLARDTLTKRVNWRCYAPSKGRFFIMYRGGYVQGCHMSVQVTSHTYLSCKILAQIAGSRAGAAVTAATFIFIGSQLTSG